VGLDRASKELQYEEDVVSRLDQDVQKLRTKVVILVKVQWKYHSVEEATWEE